MVWLWRVLLVGVGGASLYIGWSLVQANSALVSVSYVIGEFPEAPQWLVLAICFGSGASLLALAWIYQGIKASLTRRSYRRKVAELESELHQLRNLPLRSEAETAGARKGASDELPQPGA
jgi:hypothetical protein